MECVLSKLDVRQGDVVVLSIDECRTEEAVRKAQAILAGCLESLNPLTVVVLAPGQRIDSYEVSETGQLLRRERQSLRISTANYSQGIFARIKALLRSMACGIRQDQEIQNSRTHGGKDG